MTRSKIRRANRARPPSCVVTSAHEEPTNWQRRLRRDCPWTSERSKQSVLLVNDMHRNR
jgi:5-methylcytosine-specific restriction endonuclease McrA